MNVSMNKVFDIQCLSRHDGPGWKCVEVCYADVLTIVGRKMIFDAVIEEVNKDTEFYEISGGGMTISGGYPLLQVQGCQEP